MVDGQLKSVAVGHIKKELPTHVVYGGNVIKLAYRRSVGNFNCS